MGFEDETWAVEWTPEFDQWWQALSRQEQADVGAAIEALRRKGPGLEFPLSSQIRSSRFGRMRELRIQHGGRPYRILYAFDSRRVAVLLLGGDKSGDGRWYQRMVRRADALFERHLRDIGGN